MVVTTTITLFAQSTTPTALPTFPIPPGSYEGNINESIPSVRYSFEANIGDQVTILMEQTSGNLDPLLFLFDINDELLLDNDDAGDGNRNAEIQFTPEVAGTYTIEATRLGDSTGTFRLQLNIEGTGSQENVDPLSVPPNFQVDFTFLDYEAFAVGSIPVVDENDYFVLGGEQGDFVRIIMTVRDGDLVPSLNILSDNLESITLTTQERNQEIIVFATLPKTGWYLLETGGTGLGTFDLYATVLADAIIESDDLLEGNFSPTTPIISYIFNATIGDRVFASLTTTETDSQVIPEIAILDLNQLEIDRVRSETRQARSRITIPRSGSYILQVVNANPNTGGSFTVNLSRVPVDVSKLEDVTSASYNDTYKGEINDDTAVEYYQFSGKAGELVSIAMLATENSQTFDPYLILADENLNELIFNDNTGNSRDASIRQFSLPQDGEYFILTTRPNLALGSSTGQYDLELTVGQISLVNGSIMATLQWQGDADLNLFVRDPQGQTISWSNPDTSNGGTLQIDSNTNCETPTDQPIEHIYWTTSVVPNGNYLVWVWFQNVCGLTDDITFSLQVQVNNQLVYEITPTDNIRLSRDERLETTFRITDQGVFLLEEGVITLPTPQQRASEGGDILLFYGQSQTANLNNEVYARFYQFFGDQGDTIRIHAERITGNLDPIIILRTANDINLAQNDDTNGNTRNSMLEYTLPESGQYVIAVTRFGVRDGTTTGDFRLTIEQINS